MAANLGGESPSEPISRKRTDCFERWREGTRGRLTRGFRWTIRQRRDLLTELTAHRAEWVHGIVHVYVEGAGVLDDPLYDLPIHIRRRLAGRPRAIVACGRSEVQRDRSLNARSLLMNV